MRKNVLALMALLCLCGSLLAQQWSSPKVEADWESINQRGYPQWFNDAKLGIFIHWGLYSVPAYASKEGYAEWLYRGLMTRDSGRVAIMQYFADTNGSAFEMYSRLPQYWHAELWNPDQWAQTFKEAGAQYVVLVTKHHDGYCLWDSPQRPEWNSTSSGPHRNIVEELSRSVRDAGLRMCCYYSLPEWTNPLHIWAQDADDSIGRYVDQYMVPQLKDLIDRYRPDMIFADGDWTNTSDQFRSTELISYYYNTVGPDAIVNNRWGNGNQHGFLTPEYSAGINVTDRPWAECRGLGRSFGLNRNEDLDNILSGRELIQHFAELVAHGGGMTLNVGPNADGTIPFIQLDRLRQLGRWLDINGEAIYGSRPMQAADDGATLCGVSRKRDISLPVSPTINYNWVRNAPVSYGRPDHFSVVWKGEPMVNQSGRYTISAEADDEVVVLLDGDTIINLCQGEARRNLNSKTLTLKAGQHYQMEVYYAEKELDANVALRWSLEDGEAIPIPATYGWKGTYMYDQTVRVFTSQPSTGCRYIIEFERPGNILVIDTFPNIDKRSKLTLLGCNGTLRWKQDKRTGRLSINLSDLDPQELNRLESAWVIKIEN